MWMQESDVMSEKMLEEEFEGAMRKRWKGTVFVDSTNMYCVYGWSGKMCGPLTRILRCIVDCWLPFLPACMDMEPPFSSLTHLIIFHKLLYL